MGGEIQMNASSLNFSEYVSMRFWQIGADGAIDLKVFSQPSLNAKLGPDVLAQPVSKIMLVSV